MPKQKTIPELKSEIADNERQLRRSRYTAAGFAEPAAADKQSKEQECCQQEGYLSFHFIHLFSNRMWADLSSDKTRTYRKKFPKCCSYRTQ